MQVDLTSGGHRIIASGDVFLFGESNELTIKVAGDDSFDVRVTLEFLSDESTEHKIKRSIVDNSLILSCYNFGGDGTGLSRPAYIADVTGKGVFLMFWMYEEGIKERKAKSVKYTLFYEQ